MEQDRKEQMDTFWDISRLVPQKKDAVQHVSQGKSVNLSEIRLESSDPKNQDEDHILHFTEEKRESARHAEPSVIYENFSFLIRRVEIVPWKSSYHYYEFFCKNAIAYHEIRGKECPRVPFFSYVAQYSQMSQKQLDYYFWWRENVRKSVYIDTDISYIYLYIYEIINLGNQLDLSNALETLIGIWSHYRNLYPQLDKSLGEWICDYSLLYRVPISFPDARIDHEMISHCTLREAYYHFDEKDTTHTLASFLLNDCNAYDYRKSKFYDGKAKKIYDMHIPACFAQVVPFLRLFNQEEKTQLRHISRVAFMGALCSFRVRKHIEVDYIPLMGNGELKSRITDIVKYIENKLRSCLEIRSRLGIHEIPEKIRSVIDIYFASQFPGKLLSAPPDYEKLYERCEEEFSLEKALNIERCSWNVTEKLVEASEENVSYTKKTSVNEEIPAWNIQNQSETIRQNTEVTDSHIYTNTDTTSDPDPVSMFLTEITEYRVFFDAVLSGNGTARREFCKEKHLLEESVLDMINEKAVDLLGDIVIEEADGNCRILEEYRDMFRTEDKNAKQ